MKKSLLVLFVMIITASCFVLTGCGGSDGGGSAAADEGSAAVSKYVGTWKATKGTFKDEEVNVDEVPEAAFSIECKEDGTATIASADGNEEAKWFDTDEGLRVQGTDSDTDLKLTDTEDGNLEFSVVSFHIIFENQ